MYNCTAWSGSALFANKSQNVLGNILQTMSIWTSLHRCAGRCCFFYTCNNYAKVSFRRAVLKCYLFFFQLDSLLYTNVELRAHATNIFLDLCVVKLVIMQDQFWYFFTQFIEFQFLSGKIIANQKLHEMSFRKFSSCWSKSWVNIYPWIQVLWLQTFKWC